MSTTFLVPYNNAESTLASDISDTATTLTVATGEGSNFPSSYPYHLTIEDEILSCTSRTGDVLTITRAQEGTVAAAHIATKAVKLNPTAKHISDLNTAVNNIENEKGAASGLASLNASTKVVEQPASITDHLEDTPSDAEVTKAPTSNWAHDHAVATTGIHGVGASTVDSVANRDSAIATETAYARILAWLGV